MSGIAQVELELQRSLSAAFIEADSIDVVLQRSARTPDGAGGYTTGTPVPLGSQRMRLIPQQDGGSPRFTADGQEVTPAYVLMGSYSADMERGDEFTLAGKRYQIVFVNANRQYEVKGEVAYLG